jgi:hypothetical protein
MAGGVTIPLHIYFAAAIDPDLMSTTNVDQLLESRLETNRQLRWPGHLASLVLGRMAYDQTIIQGKMAVRHLDGEERRQAEEFAKQQVDFWWGVKLLTMGDTAGFLTAMKNYSEFSWADFDANGDLLICKFRTSELYLARCESERT